MSASSLPQHLILFVRNLFQEWRDRRIHKEGFETWLPNPLTETQVAAVASHFPNTLVVAGAGSGKTTLVLGRAKYLVESGRAKPENILALAFNRVAAEELEERSKNLGIPLRAQTFHGYGNSLLNSSGRLGGIAFAEQQEVENFLAERISHSLSNDPKSRLIIFFSEMLVPFRKQEHFKYIEDYNAFVRAIPRTFANEKVKSHGELIIANYLFRRGATYSYETIYEQGKRSHWHRPDFTVQAPGKEFYIEYFGIDKNGKTAPYIDNETYNHEIELKRDTHETYQTTLVELTYQDLREGVLIEKLEKQLRLLKVPERWRSAEEVRKAASETGYTTTFMNLCQSFLAHARAQRLGPHDFKSMGSGNNRTTTFLEIFAEFLTDYEAELTRLGLPDYSAMILEAADLLSSGKVGFDFNHVLVDEYQDISADRQQLLDAMKIANPKTEFLYVGDDWQSINRFAGADVGIMRAASRRGFSRKIVRLAETHRFPQSLADISSRFIQKNPKQIKKKIISTNPSNAAKSLFIHTDTFEGDHFENLKRVVGFIDKENNGTSTLLVIARYNDNRPLPSEVAQIWKGPFDIRSIHASKGSEADYVVVMDVAQDWRGFPSTITDDPILDLVLPLSEKYEYAEERRLFYVALTRARIACHLVAPLQHPSLFIEELANEGLGEIIGPKEIEVLRCPVCKSGVLTENRKYGGSSCSNSPACIFRSPKCEICERRQIVKSTSPLAFRCSEGCNSIASVCRACGWGIIVSRNGRFGEFQGCTNYMTIGCKGNKASTVYKRRHKNRRQ